MTYTIETLDIKTVSEKDLQEIADLAQRTAEAFENKFDWRKFKVLKYIALARLSVCRRDGKIVGMMLARLCSSLFDDSKKILMQDLLVTEPGAWRAAKLLLDDFIDFGKGNANHIITMIAGPTNIKPRSLKKLGFHKLETHYRMEIENE